jgi:hypothetical protein
MLKTWHLRLLAASVGVVAAGCCESATRPDEGKEWLKPETEECPTSLELASRQKLAGLELSAYIPHNSFGIFQ